ncbi:MAG: hypothetical protein ACHQAY_16385 [Hyphomicrobiales bacterium]
MSINATDHACILWMELDGDIYSPEVSLGRATRDMIVRDLGDGAYKGTCHAVYSYGTYRNGGSYCSEITSEIARALSRRSLEASAEPCGSVRAFLDAEGLEYFRDAGERADRLRPQDRLFQLHRPAKPASPKAKRAPRQRRAKPLSPEELRAQPQFKLPIQGGKQGVAPQSIRTEFQEEDGVEVLSMKEARPAAEIKADWERFDQKLRDLGFKLPKDETIAVPVSAPLKVRKG